MGILLISSRPLVIRRLYRFLRDDNCHYIPYRSDTRTLRQFTSSTRVNLILYSLRVPSVSNVRLIRTLRQLYNQRHTFRTVVLAKHTSGRSIVGTLQTKVTSCCRGPVSLSRVLRKLQHRRTTLRRQRGSLRLKRLGHGLRFLSRSVSSLCRSLSGIQHKPRINRKTTNSTSSMRIPTVFSRLSPHRLSITQLINGNRAGCRVTYRLNVARGAIGLCISRILHLARVRGHARLTLTLSPNITNSQIQIATR